MVWLEYVSETRVFAVASWVGAVVVQSWRLPLTAVFSAVRGDEAECAGIRMTPVSEDWLRRHESESAKRQ